MVGTPLLMGMPLARPARGQPVRSRASRPTPRGLSARNTLPVAPRNSTVSPCVGYRGPCCTVFRALATGGAAGLRRDNIALPEVNISLGVEAASAYGRLSSGIAVRALPSRHMPPDFAILAPRRPPGCRSRNPCRGSLLCTWRKLTRKGGFCGMQVAALDTQGSWTGR